MHSAGRVRRTVLAHALDVCKTENQTRDTTHGGARRKAPSPVCPKRPFAIHADRLRPRNQALHRDRRPERTGRRMRLIRRSQRESTRGTHGSDA